jgi:alpha-galactosidase
MESAIGDRGREPSESRTTAGTRLDADDLTVAYVGGGSRQWVPNLVQDLALSPFDGTVRLYDVDVESAERNAEFGNWVGERAAANSSNSPRRRAVRCSATSTTTRWWTSGRPN